MNETNVATRAFFKIALSPKSILLNCLASSYPVYSCRDLVTVYTVGTAACAGEAEGQGERRRAINVSTQRLFILCFHFPGLCDLPVKLFLGFVLREGTSPFLFHPESLFSIQTRSSATGSFRLFLSAPRTATGDAAHGAVRGAEPEPPVILIQRNH